MFARFTTWPPSPPSSREFRRRVHRNGAAFGKWPLLSPPPEGSTRFLPHLHRQVLPSCRRSTHAALGRIWWIVVSDGDLASALVDFDRVAVTLNRLQAVWDELAGLTPEAMSRTPDDRRYRELCRVFDGLAKGLPAIGGHRIDSRPMLPDEIIQNRWDAIEVGMVEARMSVEQAIEEPGEAVAEYRHRFAMRRRQLVRQRANELIAAIDELLAKLHREVPADQSVNLRGDTDWTALEDAWSELVRVVGDADLQNTRASDFWRHVRFGDRVDLDDIVEQDWPSVRPVIERALYHEDEPMPIAVDDLDTLVQARPTGRVSTKLSFDSLDDVGFERLVFNLLTSTEGYENAKWLSATNAPDRGRDLSVERVVADRLAGTRRERIIVQCKKWRKSLSATECSNAVAPMYLWGPPPIDELIIATTGRFSTDGIQWIENHNAAGNRPRVEMWPDSHLELLLAGRGALIEEFNLRSS